MTTQMPVAQALEEQVSGDSLRFRHILSLKFLKRIHSECLHYHAAHGNKQEVLRLLESGALPNVPGYRGKTPLMLACANRHAECATLLLTYGSNVLLCTGDHARTCLHYAAKGGDPACLRTVLQFAKEHPMDTPWGLSNFVNWRDKLGVTALHYAARSHKVESVRMLLREGAYLSLNNAQHRTSPVGSFPLHWAAAAGDVAVVKELLVWGADRALRDCNCQTAYMVAMRSGNVECAAALNPRAEEPLSWPTPWEHILPAQGSQARQWLEAALAEALSPAATAAAGAAAAAARGSRAGKGQKGAGGAETETLRGNGGGSAGRTLSRRRTQSLGVSRGREGVPVVRAATTDGVVQSRATALASPASPDLETSQSMPRPPSSRSADDGGATAGLPVESSGEIGLSGVLHRASRRLLSAMCIAPDASVLSRSLSQVVPDKGDQGACEGEEAEGSKANEARESELEAGVSCDICCSPKDDMLAIVPCQHQMCSLCFLSLCCHSKPSKVAPQPVSPACPFCRAKITAVTPAQPSCS